MNSIHRGSRITLPISENFASKLFMGRNTTIPINIRRQLNLTNNLQKEDEEWLEFSEINLVPFRTKDEYFNNRLNIAKDKLKSRINIRITSDYATHCDIKLNDVNVGRIFGIWNTFGPLLIIEITHEINNKIRIILKEFIDTIKEDDILFSKKFLNKRTKRAVEYNTLRRQIQSRLPNNVLKNIIKPIHSTHNITSSILSLANTRKNKNRKTRKL